MLPSGCYHCYKYSDTHKRTCSLRKKQQPKNTGMHPRRCHLIMFRCIFFAMATVIHADKASGISFKIATFESVVYFPPSSLLKDV